MPTQEPRPLEWISLSGYKSIRELKAFPMDPGLNVLIGANGSGKTNFIRFFEMLSHILDANRGLQSYVRAHGGADAVLFRGMNVTQECSAHLSFGPIEYSLTLRAGSAHSLNFASEAASFKRASAEKVYDLQGCDRHSESGLLRTHPHLDALERWVLGTIQRLRLYHFRDTSPSAPVMGVCNLVDGDVLRSDAANLAAVLMRMEQVAPTHFFLVEAAIRQIAPSFGRFILKDLGAGQTQLLWKDHFSTLTHHPNQLSAGTIRFLCLATLLLQPTPASTLIIDEPELSLHPSAIQLLANLLQDASLRCQLMVSTQSSFLLDKLTPAQVIVVNHLDGESSFKRLAPEALEGWLKDYTLGQLWEKNELGGLA